MSCSIERLAASFPAIPRDLRSHLGRCDACRRAWADYEAMADLVLDLPPAPRPDRLTHLRARRDLLGEARRGAGRIGARRGTRHLLGLAVAASVLVIGGSVLRSEVQKQRRAPLLLRPVPTAGDRGSDAGGPGDPAGGPHLDRPSSGRWLGAPSAEGAGPPTSGLRRRALSRLRVRHRRLELDLRVRRAARGGSAAAAASAATGIAGAAPRGLVGRSKLPRRDGASGDRADSATTRGAHEPDETADGATCGDRLFSAYESCLAEHGIDDEEAALAGGTEEQLQTISTCWLANADPVFDACCAARPDDTCDEGASAPPTPTEPSGTAGTTCADVLFATNERCLADRGVSDEEMDADDPATATALTVCWLEVASPAYDACCVDTPDDTCVE